MSNDRGKIRFGLWYDFRNPAQWRQPANRLYREILDQIAWGENNGFDDVWLSEHHFIEDGIFPRSCRPPPRSPPRTNRIHPKPFTAARMARIPRRRSAVDGQFVADADDLHQHGFRQLC